VAAIVPVSVNLVVMLAFGWPGGSGNPSMLAVGASAGFLAGFAALFIGLRRGRAMPTAATEPVEFAAR